MWLVMLASSLVLACLLGILSWSLVLALWLLVLVLLSLLTPMARSRRRFYYYHHSPQTPPSAPRKQLTSDHTAHWVLSCLLSLPSSCKRSNLTSRHRFQNHCYYTFPQTLPSAHRKEWTNDDFAHWVLSHLSSVVSSRTRSNLKSRRRLYSYPHLCPQTQPSARRKE